MMRELNLVLLAGGISTPSRTRILGQVITASLLRHVPGKLNVVDLAEIRPSLGFSLDRPHINPVVEEQLVIIEKADVLVVAAPVIRGSYPGYFKHVFDLLAQDALAGVPVLLAATGGSPFHAMVLDHQLRPLLSFFQAHVLPVGVYATEQDFRDGAISSEATHARIEKAVSSALPMLRFTCLQKERELVSRPAVVHKVSAATYAQ